MPSRSGMHHGRAPVIEPEDELTFSEAERSVRDLNAGFRLWHLWCVQSP